MTSLTPAELETVAAAACSTTTAKRRDSGWWHEVRALAMSLSVVLGILPVIALAWLVMWTAQVRLTPNPEAELMAELTARGGPAGPPLDAEYYEYGRKVYAGTCVACHGTNGRGIQGNGKDLIHSEFITKNDDDFLVAFLKKGRDLSDPLNTSKILMPPKGGNPVLNEDDLYDVVTFVRGLQDPRRIPKPGVKHDSQGGGTTGAAPPSSTASTH